MSPPRILLISLGNPAPYLNTLHSAGHHALNALQQLLHPAQPAFEARRLASKKALASYGPDYLLLQSPSIMNVSGKWVSAAYRDLQASVAEEAAAEGAAGAVTETSPSTAHDASNANLHLLLVHDDLEEDLGVVKMRKWSSSHRGHNGIKSVNSFLKPSQFPGARWARVSIGVGRPEGREKETVSDYVLKEMTRHQQSVLKDKAGRGLLKCLQEWEAKMGNEP